MSDISLIQFHLQFCKLLFSSCIKSNLSSCIATCFLQLFIELIQLTSKRTTSFVGSCSCLTFSFQLFIKLFKSSLQLLNLSIELSSKGLFIFNLSHQRAVLFLFPLEYLTKLNLVALQINNCLLSKLEISFNLSLNFFNISLVFLLPLPAIFNFIKTLLKSNLQLVQMIALVLIGLDLLLFLQLTFRYCFLLFVKLVDQLLLMKTLFLHLLDLSIFHTFFILYLGKFS